MSGLWIPNKQHVHHDWADADDQRGWYEVIVARQWREHHQNCPWVGPQVHGIRAGMTKDSVLYFKCVIYVSCCSWVSINSCIFHFNWPLQIKRLIGSDKETLSILERFVAGSMAGVIAQSTIYPMEVIISLITPTLEMNGSQETVLNFFFFLPNLSPGPKNSSCSADDRSVLWYLRLCQAASQERRTWSVL